MYSLIKTSSSAIFIVLGLWFGLGSERAAAETPERCNDWMVKGNWSTEYFGAVTPDGATFIPIAELGFVTLDGRGHLTGSDTVSVGGNVFVRQITGTYSVKPDCTVALVGIIDGNAENPERVNGVIVDGGDLVQAIVTNQGETVSGRARRVAR